MKIKRSMVLTICFVALVLTRPAPGRTEDRKVAAPALISQAGLDEGRIVWCTDRHGPWQIYVMDADGTNKARLTNDLVDNYHPVWAKDGQWIYYSRNQDIYRMRPDGSNPQFVVASGTDPDTSFDSEKLVYLDPSGEYKTMILYDLKTKAKTVVIPDLAPAFQGKNLAYPSLSPDGTQFAFASNYPSPWTNHILDLVDEFPAYFSRGCMPQYSPDGSRIAWINTVTHELYIGTPDGQDSAVFENAIPGRAHNYFPKWSSDNRYLVFAASPEATWASDYEIFIKPSSGGDATRLTFDTGSDIWPDLLMPHVTLTLASEPGGTVEPRPGTYLYAEGTSVSVRAVPLKGWLFTGWSGDRTGSENPLNIVMSTGESITAGFSPVVEAFTLDVSVSPSGSGTVFSNPSGGVYENGETVVLTPEAASGFLFSHWSGDVVKGTEAAIPLILTMNSDKQITANFDVDVPPEIFLSTAQLNFGAAPSTAPAGEISAAAVTKTSNQLFSVENRGGGVMRWWIVDNGTWLNCTPVNGTGGAQVTVSVNPENLAAGHYSALISVFSENAINSPQTVTVNLQVFDQFRTASPFGSFDTPTEGSRVDSSVPFTGWALDDIQVAGVKIYREQNGELVFIGDAVFVEGARPDVEQLHPKYPYSSRAGWGYMMLTNFLPNGGNGTFTFYALATDVEGRQSFLGSKRITVDNANSVNPFGAIDTPAQGGQAGGSAFVNFGWALTPQPNFIPVDGSTLLVWIDGKDVGRPVYGQLRSDIAANFEGYANSQTGVGYFYIDTTEYENGVHTIQWTVADSAGNTGGIGSRYFSIFNQAGTGSSSSSRGRLKSLVRKGNPGGHDLNIPLDPRPAAVNLNAGEAERFLPIVPDETGTQLVEIKEDQRLEILFPESLDDGFLLLGEDLRPLPIGSTLERKPGTFYWQPGPGFLGEYRFGFISDKGTRFMVAVMIRPKF